MAHGHYAPPGKIRIVGVETDVDFDATAFVP